MVNSIGKGLLTDPDKALTPYNNNLCIFDFSMKVYLLESNCLYMSYFKSFSFYLILFSLDFFKTNYCNFFILQDVLFLAPTYLICLNLLNIRRKIWRRSLYFLSHSYCNNLSCFLSGELIIHFCTL